MVVFGEAQGHICRLLTCLYVAIVYYNVNLPASQTI